MRWVLDSTLREVATAAVLAFVLFFVGTADVPLIPRDEARFAEAAREMMARGDAVVPTFGGANRYDKPILIYWCVWASYAVLGIDERAARLPSNVAGALTVMLLAWTARRRWGPGAGLVAGLLLATTVAFHVQCRACTADLVMMLPTLAAMLALERIWAGESDWRHALVLWTGLALALLAKGPVGPAFVLFTGVALWALGRSWRRWEVIAAVALVVAGWWRLGVGVLAVPVLVAAVDTLRSSQARQGLARLRWTWGVPLLLGIVLPWALAANAATGGEFWQVGVGRHVVERTVSPLESHGGFPGFYLITACVAAFPWFPLVGAGVRAAWREHRHRFLVAWLLGPLLLVELVATKLVHYWMLSYPAGVLLVVGWLWNEERRPPGRMGRVVLAFAAVILAALPIAVSLIYDLDKLLLMAVVVAVPVLVGGVWAATRVGRQPVRAVVGLVVGSALYLVLLLAGFLPELSRHFAGPRAASRTLELQRPDEQIVVYKARDDELFFYLPLDIINCRPRTCLAEMVLGGRVFLGVARVDDLDEFREEFPALGIEEVERVRGVDLGHGRWTELTLFRPAGAE